MENFYIKFNASGPPIRGDACNDEDIGHSKYLFSVLIFKF